MAVSLAPVLALGLLLAQGCVSAPSAASKPAAADGPTAASSASRPGSPSPAQASAPPAAQPIPRTDPNSQAAHSRLLEQARAGGIDIYFLGDSITRRWASTEDQYADLRANWISNFQGWKVGDFGWGGDTTQNILWRIENGELDGVSPKVIVLLAGTNNLPHVEPQGTIDAKATGVTDGIRAIVSACRSKAPHATIVLMGITPRNDKMELLPVIDRINQNLATLADGKTVRYVNINGRLADAEGRLYPGMVNPDGLHLAVKAYQIWADALKPILTEVVGPPAAR